MLIFLFVAISLMLLLMGNIGFVVAVPTLALMIGISFVLAKGRVEQKNNYEPYGWMTFFLLPLAFMAYEYSFGGVLITLAGSALTVMVVCGVAYAVGTRFDNFYSMLTRTSPRE